MINAAKVALYLGLPYRFVWPEINDPNRFHTVGTADDLFDPEYAAEHILPKDTETSGFRMIDARGGVDNDGLLELVGGGRPLRIPFRGLDTILRQGEFQDDCRTIRAGLDLVEFSPRILEAIENARLLSLPADSVAVHLRAGDVIYGVFRKFPKFLDKAIPLAIAERCIERILETNRSPVLIGQEGSVVAYLSQKYSCQTSGVASVPDDRYCQAFHDLVIMSRCSSVVAPDSTFSTLAGQLGGISVQRPEQLVSVDGWLEASTASIPLVGVRDVSLHRAYTLSRAVIVGWSRLSVTERDKLLNEALVLDVDNQMLYLLLAANSYSESRDAEGDDYIGQMFSRELLTGEVGRLNDGLHMYVKKAGKGYEFSNFFPYFRAAALRGSEFASLLEAMRAKVDGSASVSLVHGDGSLLYGRHFDLVVNGSVR